MSDPTAEKSEAEIERDKLLKTYIKGEQAKMAELQRKKNPSVKQKLWKEITGTIRGAVERF